MLVLGIETSCDETSVGLFKTPRKVLANVVYSSLKEHRPFGGVVPEIASRAHLETLLPCLRMALRKARVNLSQVDLIAATQGPGLMGSLLVGLSAGKALALALKKPLIGVDHVLAHAYSGVLEDPKLKFPFISLVVSGGHTLILHAEAPDRWQVLGKTLDDAAGEAFDKVAKILGLGYPGGPEIDRLAKGQNTAHITFSRPILSKESLDFSFSGIKTAVYYKVLEFQKRRALTPQVKKQMAAGFQEAVCDVLTQKALLALNQAGLRSLVVGGGVSANSRLRTKLTAAAKVAGAKVIFPSMALCRDNAAMIAALGAAQFAGGRRSGLNAAGYPRFEEGDLVRAA